MLRVVDARNRYASVEDRRQVESLFRRAQDEFRKLVNASWRNESGRVPVTRAGPERPSRHPIHALHRSDTATRTAR